MADFQQVRVRPDVLQPDFQQTLIDTTPGLAPESNRAQPSDKVSLRIKVQCTGQERRSYSFPSACWPRCCILARRAAKPRSCARQRMAVLLNTLPGQPGTAK